MLPLFNKLHAVTAKKPLPWLPHVVTVRKMRCAETVDWCALYEPRQNKQGLLPHRTVHAWPACRRVVLLTVSYTPELYVLCKWSEFRNGQNFKPSKILTIFQQTPLFFLKKNIGLLLWDVQLYTRIIINCSIYQFTWDFWRDVGNGC
jgi:hypothetical protein